MVTYTKFDISRREDGTFTVAAFITGRKDPLYKVDDIDTITLDGADIEPDADMTIDIGGAPAFDAKVVDSIAVGNDDTRFRISKERQQPALTVEQI